MQTLTRPPGILPLEKFVFGVYALPGHGENYLECGHMAAKGCLNVGDHHAGLDDLGREGKAFVRLYAKCCWRAECPVCYEKWASREASRAEFRLLSFCGSKSKAFELFSIKREDRRHRDVATAFRVAKFKPIHVIFSVPVGSYHLDVRVLRPRLYKIAKICGVFGGCAIFHPFREDKVLKRWYFSPHFHVVGFGWVRNVVKVHKKSGWVIKNKGLRETVHGTLHYQLSHAGIRKGYHVVTWFGSLARNKFPVGSMPEVRPVCSLCGSELVDLVFVGGLDRPPPDKEGEYFLPVDDWIIKPLGW